MSEAEREAFHRALDAVRYMRSRGASLTRAAQMASTTPDTVRKYARTALGQARKGGRWEVKPSDRIPRRLQFPTKKDPIDVEIRGSRKASEIARYWIAFKAFAGGRADPYALKPFEGKGITVDGTFHPYITNPELVMAQAVSTPEFEDIYATVR